MAELNWIDKNERLPTREDADCQGFVIGRDKRGAGCYRFPNVEELSQCTHWIGFKQINECVLIPKRWRTPTIQDLAKASKPIPCRVRDCATRPWFQSMLRAIDVDDDAMRFYVNDDLWYALCEIEE